MAREIVVRPTRGKVTAAWLDCVTVPEGCVRVTVKDSDVKGLELRLSATGAKAWAVSKRVGGRQRRFTLPGGDRLSLAGARRAALKLLDELGSGRDPTVERRKAREAEQLAKLGIGKAWTLRELVDEYGAKVAVPAQQRTWRERRAHVLREYKALLDVPVATIGEAHVWVVLDAATSRGARVSGMHGLQYLQTILRWALSRKLIEADPTATLPLKEIRRAMRGRPRERILSADEIGRLWRAWEAYPHDVYSVAFRLLLLTCARRGEVGGMRWVDLDLDRAEWRQPTNKADRPHSVPLSPQALAIVRAQPRRGPLVLATVGGSTIEGRRGNWGRAIARYAKISGVTGWSAHDLRRTCATTLAALRVDRGVIELLLNHSEVSAKGGIVAATYNRHGYELEKREAVVRLAERIVALAAEGTGRVVELPVRTG